jgi:2-hydroxymethylglutarate dehydrogenase
MTLGLIGVGNIGFPICQNFIKHGHEVYVHDIANAAVERAVAAGAKARRDPASVARDADVVFTCLPGPQEVEAVALGPDGVSAAARAGLVLVDLTTNFPEPVRALAAQLSQHGIAMLEAPVGNGVVGVREEGRASVICGGDAALFKRIEPLFRCFATTIHHVGPIGDASTVKSIDILISGVNLAAACEGFMLGVRAGIDPDVLFDVISTNSGSSEQLKRRMRRKILAGDFAPEGSMDLALKDVRVVLDLAERTTTPLRYGALLHEQFVASVAKGWGKEDWAVLIRLLEDVTGDEVRSRKAPS